MILAFRHAIFDVLSQSARICHYLLEHAMEHRINSPAHFKYALDALFFAVDTLYYAIDQDDHSHNVEKIEEPPEETMFGFDRSTRNIERPHEFLQTILDIVRVNYEPQPLGTTMLNSNPCFLYDAIPSTPFEIGYLSLVSEPSESFGDFWTRRIKPYAESLGYGLDEKQTMFVVCSAGELRYGLDLFSEVSETLNSGPTVEEVLASTIAIIANTPEAEESKECYSGFCLDSALDNRLRVSIWSYLSIS